MNVKIKAKTKHHHHWQQEKQKQRNKQKNSCELCPPELGVTLINILVMRECEGNNCGIRDSFLFR